MQLSIRQSLLQHLSIVPCSAFCQNDSHLDKRSIIEQIVHFPGQLHPQSLPESAAGWLQMQQRPQTERENWDPLVRLRCRGLAGKSSSGWLLT